MYIKTAFSIKTNINEIIDEFKLAFEYFESKLILFFASSYFDPKELSDKFHASFPESMIFGCSTAGEITDGKMLENSVVAMAFDNDSLHDIKIEVVTDLVNNYESGISEAFNSFEKYFNLSPSQMDFKTYVGLVLFDGLCGMEEKVMEKIGDLTDVLFIGGSAGDDLRFEKTFVYANGSYYSDAAILALLKPKLKFDFIKTQSFHITDKELVATKVNEKNREVIEFNNAPADKEYAKLLSADPSKINEYFMSFPVGLIINNEPFVRSPQRVKGHSLIFYCNLLEGMRLSILESRDIVHDTKEAVESKQKLLGEIKGLINFHCILRTQELKQKNQIIEYSNIFSRIPTIGFSTYGEAYIGHLNQTSTMLIFY